MNKDARTRAAGNSFQFGGHARAHSEEVERDVPLGRKSEETRVTILHQTEQTSGQDCDEGQRRSARNGQGVCASGVITITDALAPRSGTPEHTKPTTDPKGKTARQESRDPTPHSQSW